jgi:hypothetical protein
MICICVDGLPIQITPSLYDALHAHRHHKDKVVVWADALCINQRNLQERSNQVMLMGKIYTMAAVVHIWLGPELDGSSRAMELLEQAASANNLMTDPSPEDVSAVVALFERPWWYRIWVVQEIILARNARLLCGNSSICWEVAKAGQQALVGRCSNHPGKTNKTNRSFSDVIRSCGPSRFVITGPVTWLSLLR